MSIAHHPTHETVTCDVPGCGLTMFNPRDPNRTADERWTGVHGILLPDGRHACNRVHAEILRSTT